MTPVPQFTAREVEINEIHVWLKQPRKRGEFTEAALADILPSIRDRGLIEPIVLRPRFVEKNGGLETDGFLILAGERRFTAHTMALPGAPIPAVFRECSDSEAMVIAIEENTKRKALHAMDLAAAYADLQVMDPALRDIKALAARFNEPVAAVRRTLRLVNLVELVQEAFIADAITRAHAERIATLDAKDQAAALEACFNYLSGTPTALIKKRDWASLSLAVVQLRDFDRWLDNHRVVNVEDAMVQQELIEELKADDPKLKLEPEALVECVKLSASFYVDPATQKRLGVIPADMWKAVPPKSCKTNRPGIVIHDGPRRYVPGVCLASVPCAKHWPVAKAKPAAAGAADYRPTAAEVKAEEKRKADQLKARAESDAFAKIVPALMENLKKHIKAMKKGSVIDLAIECQQWGGIIGRRELERYFKITVKDSEPLQFFAFALVFTAGVDHSINAFRSVSKVLGFKYAPVEKQLLAALKKAETDEAAAAAKAEKKAAPTKKAKGKAGR